MITKWKVTEHAIERAEERLKVRRSNAENHIVQLMQSAVYRGMTGEGRFFDHIKSQTRIVVGKSNNSVITVYKIPEMGVLDTGASPVKTVLAPTNAIITKVRDVFKREIERLATEFNRSKRKLSEQLATHELEMAQLRLNKIRCLHPPTQAMIQTRIDELQGDIERIQRKIDAKQAEYERVKAEATAALPIS